MSRSAGRAIVVVAPFLLAWGGVPGMFAVPADRLPSPLATPFGASGHADGFTGPGAFLSVVSALLLVPGAVAGGLAFRSRTPLGAQRARVAVAPGGRG
ncbi:hypothetical protein [Streptomyces sp. NPDC048636]|uniref:hypothetical protein n=1 Tax=Streptomyces sp. NPDC048636 TaxID=3155762 RepID=UPI0034439E44